MCTRGPAGAVCCMSILFWFGVPTMKCRLPEMPEAQNVTLGGYKELGGVCLVTNVLIIISAC